MSKLIERLQSTAMEHQSATAIGGDEPMTFSQLWSRTDVFAGGLRSRDITAGDAVAIRLSDANPRAFLVAFFGTLRNGSVPVTVPSDDAVDVGAVLNETHANAFVTDQRRLPSVLTRADELRVAITVDRERGMGIDLASFLDNSGMNTSTRSGIDVVRRADEDRGLIAYVGHHDGAPLGVTYSQATLSAAATAGAAMPIGELNQVDPGKSATPPTDDGDGSGLLGAVALSNPLALLYGAAATILDGGRYRPIGAWDPETARSLRHTTDLNRLFVTPAQYEDLRSLGIDDTAGIAVLDTTPVVEERPDETAAVNAVTRCYGVPETGLTHVRSPADVQAGRLGMALSGVETTTFDGDDGPELAISGPAVMDGYFGRPELTAEITETSETNESDHGTRWIRTGAPVTTEDKPYVLEGTPSTASFGGDR